MPPALGHQHCTHVLPAPHSSHSSNQGAAPLLPLLLNRTSPSLLQFLVLGKKKIKIGTIPTSWGHPERHLPSRALGDAPEFLKPDSPGSVTAPPWPSSLLFIKTHSQCISEKHQGLPVFMESSKSTRISPSWSSQALQCPTDVDIFALHLLILTCPHTVENSHPPCP